MTEQLAITLIVVGLLVVIAQVVSIVTAITGLKNVNRLLDYTQERAAQLDSKLNAQAYRVSMTNIADQLEKELAPVEVKSKCLKCDGKGILWTTVDSKLAAIFKHLVASGKAKR